jgi:hypothetical protein
VRPGRIARRKGLTRRLIDGRRFGLVLTGKQPALGFEPILFSSTFGATALLPKPICELPLLPYIELRAHDTWPSDCSPLDDAARFGMRGLCQRRGAPKPPRSRRYEIRRATITATSDNAVSAMPVA